MEIEIAGIDEITYGKYAKNRKWGWAELPGERGVSLLALEEL